MKNRIKSLFQGAVSLEQMIRSAKNRGVNHYSFSVVSSFLPFKSFIPVTQWATSPTFLLHALNYIAINKPKIIVEFGSGVSTILISKLLMVNDIDCSFYSIDHDADWLDKVDNWLQLEEAKSTRCNLLCIPLEEEYAFKGRPIKWYKTSIITDVLANRQPDLLIIDGPPGALEYSRSGALIHFQSLVREGLVTYFFDDINRSEEKEIVETLGRDNMYFDTYALGGKKEFFDSRPISSVK